MKHPISLWLELEGRCNLACRFCYNFWRGQPDAYPRTLPTGTLLRGVAELLDEFDCGRVVLSGGEPLLRPDLEEIVRFLKSRRLRLVITTNGTLVTAEKMDALQEWGVDTVQVSLHSANAIEHNWLSAGEAFRAALLALMRVRERGIGAAGVFVATKRNLASFPDTLRLLARIDVRIAIFNRFIVSGLGVRYRGELGVPDDRAVLDMLQEAQSIAAKYGQTIIMGTPVSADVEVRRKLWTVRFGSCPVRQNQTRWTIGVDGEIRRCNHSDVSIGNIANDGVTELARVYGRSNVALRLNASCGQCQLNSEYFRAQDVVLHSLEQ